MYYLIFALIVAAAVAVVCCVKVRFPSSDLWPPISEDEFIRRCSPGVDRGRALKVRRIISEQLGVDYDRVYPGQRFVEDLGCD
ncbi:acyl carrier protein [Rubripirellula reticaptiva]|uniref:Acyl carrier protein n=1 Tax=Rubripirellula reticaptiva TaxID=2528013 RepID=A0A5C6F773_9BACT|nr:hypothetical protein [Rubripirellula reticaptiva]TWU55341.1 Acyl carrier protein [Rubripirellula reticaptiva]